MSPRHSPLILALLVAAAAIQASSCRCNCGQAAVARVISLVQATEISTAGGQWGRAAPEDQLHVGDALRTNESGNAIVEIFGQGEIRVSPDSLVRFADLTGEGSDQELRLVFENGSLDVTSAADEDAPMLVIDGPEGRVRLERGTRARLILDEAQRVRVDVAIGTAMLEESTGTSSVGAGSSGVLGGGAPDGGAAADGDGDADGSVDASANVDAPDLDDMDGGVMEGVTVRARRGARLELQAPGEEEFSRARGRTVTIEAGTVVRVTGRDGADVVGPSGATVMLRPGSTVAVNGARGERLEVALRGGSAEARAEGSGVATLTVPGGRAATARLGASAAFLATVLDRGRTRVQVRSGAAFVRSGERTERVLTGAEVVLGPDGRISLSSRQDVPPLLQGGSAVLHDPQRRGAFTIRFSPITDCSAYVVQVDHRGRRLVDAVTSRPSVPLTDLAYGSYSWRAACLRDGSPDWSLQRDGRVLRQADRSGHVLLPTKAPRNALDSDGRRYTVMYQNRLPAITLRWSDAPEAPRYVLEVYNDGTGRRVHRGTLSRASLGFRSGFFAEGNYYWFFRAEGGEGRPTSPVTRAAITYDNQAPTIQILEPREGAAASGSVRVRGVAAVGSTVVVNGVTLGLTGAYRFDQVVPVGPGNLVIFRVSTPRRGVGYYLRHLSR